MPEEIKGAIDLILKVSGDIPAGATSAAGAPSMSSQASREEFAKRAQTFSGLAAHTERSRFYADVFSGGGRGGKLPPITPRSSYEDDDEERRSKASIEKPLGLFSTLSEIAKGGKEDQDKDGSKQGRGFLMALLANSAIQSLIHNSQSARVFLSTISELLGAIFDIFVGPLMPIFGKIMEAIVPLLPVLQEALNKLAAPIVEVMLKLVELFIDNMPAIEQGIRDFSEKMVPVMQEVANMLQSVYNHFTGKDKGPSEEVVSSEYSKQILESTPEGRQQLIDLEMQRRRQERVQNWVWPWEWPQVYGPPDLTRQGVPTDPMDLMNGMVEGFNPVRRDLLSGGALADRSVTINMTMNAELTPTTDVEDLKVEIKKAIEDGYTEASRLAYGW